MEPSVTPAASNPNAEALRKARSAAEAEAADAWGAVLALSPGHPEALAALMSLAEGPQREAALAALRTAAEKSEAKNQAATYVALASLLEVNPEQREQARDAYEAALKAVPSDLEAFSGLASLLEVMNDEERLIDAFLARVEHAEPGEAAALFSRVAARFQARGDVNAAYELLAEGLSNDLSNDRLAAELEQAATQSSRWGDLITRFANTLNSLGDSPSAIPLANTVARWYSKLGQPEYAISYHEFVLKREARDREALALVAPLYEKTNRHAQRANALWQLSQVTDSVDERREVTRQLALVYERDLKSPKDAIRAYQALLDADSSDDAALESLENIYRTEANWESLAETLTRRAQIAKDRAVAASMRRKVGEMFEVELQDINRAISAYKEALDLDPQDSETRQALEELLDRTNRHRELLELIDVRVESAPEAERMALLRRRAELLEVRLNRPEEAAQTYERLLERAPADEASFKALCRLLAKEERWSDYAKAVRRRLEAAPSRDLASDLLRELGEVFDQRLDDKAQAIEVYEELLGRTADDLGALRALSRLYTEAKEWDRAMSTMRRLVDRLPEQKERVEVYQRMGEIAHRELGNSEQAQRLYQFAIDVDPSYLPAVRALRQIYEERESYDDAVRLLRQEEQHTQTPADKTKILIHLGDLLAKNLSDERRAAEAYRQALTHSPRSVEAARPLAAIAFAQERHAEAEPLFEILVEEIKGGREEARAAGLHTLHHRLGTCAEKLGKPDKALKHFRAAYEIDDKNPALLYDLAQALYQTGELERAFGLYQDLLQTSAPGEDEATLVEIYHRLGAIRWARQDAKQAASFFEQALKLNPRHRQTLESMIEVRRQEERFEEVVALQRTRVEVARDAAERFARLSELGELQHAKLKNSLKAISAYQEALELRPEDRTTLFQLMTLYHETRQWQRAVDMIQRIAVLEAEPKKRARYHNTTAVILRDELKNSEEARQYFEKALDGDPLYEYAFDSLKAILTERGDYRELERTYRRQLMRLPREGEVATVFVKLSHDLGVIYRDHLEQNALAAEAFEMAARLDPENIERHEILAELYGKEPTLWERAVEHHRVLLRHNPNRAQSYQALFGLYTQGLQYDKAFCLAATLAFMRRAGQEEQAVLDRHARAKELPRATRRLDDELWRGSVAHPEETQLINQIFRLVWNPLSQLLARPEKELGLNRKKERVDVATSDLPLAKEFSYTQQTLGALQPELHVRSTAEGFNFANALIDRNFQPIAIVGPDVYQGKSEREMVFLLARSLTYLRPEYYVARAAGLQVPTLRLSLLGALKTAAASFPVPKADEPTVLRVVERLRPLVSGAQLAQLSQLAQKILDESPDLSLVKWLERVELTANRAAFALCGDLEIAARVIQAEAAPTGSMSAKDKLKDLVLYSVSEEYFSFRTSLGLQIKGR